MVRKYPEMKDVFPQPPVVSFRKARNISDKLVRADHSKRHSRRCHTTTTTKTRSDIDILMNNSGVITNTKSGITLPIRGGAATERNVIYAARCTKHDCISVGQTTIPLNKRMNLHRSDTNLYPEKCELTQHFSKNDCDFTKDLEISILQSVSGCTERMLLEEDRWITRLGTTFPNGLNKRLSSFGKLYYKLFD